ncbi:hypothetical protein H9X57_14160 [Flavobacterium piscinae]|uniref:hypothetical protein n=1 Tax=Flavobacterium piscinae TaxID=2506424 RepID=UPI00198DC411|nr:hypothetical protein [Flavobacterium piscinae]MBC8884069.1 hypothetical protein [Flavobacterium piscinae]
MMENKIQWLNVYSLSDALSSNFRKDATRGESEYGFKDSSIKPENINYEITADKSQNIFTILSRWMESECISFTGILTRMDIAVFD